MESYASLHTIARCFCLGLCSIFGTLPPTMAPCQYSRIGLEEAVCRPTTFGKIPINGIVGTLPKIPHLNPYRSQLTQYLTSVTKLAQIRHIFVDIFPWPLTFELGSQKSPLRLRPFFMSNMKAIGQTVPFCGRLRVCSIMCSSQILQRKL